MSSTLAASAVDAIIAALQVAPPVATLIDRVHLRPFSASTFSAVVVRPANRPAVPQKMMNGLPAIWTLGVDVECYVRLRTSDDLGADQAVEALLAPVYARLMSDITLSGAVKSVQPLEINYDFDSDADKTACAILSFEVKQACIQGTLST